MRIGLADHFGWAVAVTVTPDGDVADRRRIELVEPGVCAAPIHYERDRHGLDGLAVLVADVRASIERASAASLDALAGDLGAPVTTLALRTWPDDFPRDITTISRPPYEARADAVMYREVLAGLAAERGWEVHRYDAKRVVAEAVRRRGAVDDTFLRAVREVLGPPWTADHRVALAAALVSG